MQSKLSKAQHEQALELLRYFTIDGEPADTVATEGQVEIFGCIVFEVSDRQHIMTSTQYGKSLFVAFACIILSCLDGDIVTVVAPNDDKAHIIMRYYIEHIGDNIIFSSQLDKTNKLERLQMTTSKDRVVLKNKGGLFLISLQAGNSKKGFEAAMGEGSRKVIQDESCLIPDDIEATAFRMIAGKKNAMYVKIGNPFYKTAPHTHFFKSSRDPAYLHISIDYHQALEEGRYSRAFIEEARTKPLFSVLYENKFPDSRVQDDDGYIELISQATLDNAYLPEDIELPLLGEKRMGIDLAGGGRNKSSIVIRGENLAKIAWSNRSSDPMVVISKAVEIAKAENIPIDDRYIFPDKTGAIAWCARLNELYPIGKDNHTNNFGVVVGTAPEEEEDQSHKQFLNLRAQMSFRVKDWLGRGGKLVGKPAFDQALVIRYKVQSDKKIKIKSKDDMRKDGIESPDEWDALALTFAIKPKAIHKKFKQADVQQDKYGLF